MGTPRECITFEDAFWAAVWGAPLWCWAGWSIVSASGRDEMGTLESFLNNFINSALVSGVVTYTGVVPH